MESADNALAVAVRLLKDTQQLVLTQQQRRQAMPAQLQDMGRQLMGYAQPQLQAWLEQGEVGGLVDGCVGDR